MKMRKERFEELEGHINAYLDNYEEKDLQDLIRMYQDNVAFNDYRVAFIWAMFRRAVPDYSEYIRELYHNDMLNDSHVETALKKVFRDRGLLYP